MVSMNQVRIYKGLVLVMIEGKYKWIFKETNVMDNEKDNNAGYLVLYKDLPKSNT